MFVLNLRKFPRDVAFKRQRALLQGDRTLTFEYTSFREANIPYVNMEGAGFMTYTPGHHKEVKMFRESTVFISSHWSGWTDRLKTRCLRPWLSLAGIQDKPS